MKEIEKILTSEEFEEFTCACGNSGADTGFFPCDAEGNEIEPTLDSGWANLYVCASCGRVYEEK